MEWDVTDAQSLAIIDREIGKTLFSPAEYEIIRRVIYQTADFDYLSLLRFSKRALQSGAAVWQPVVPLLLMCQWYRWALCKIFRIPLLIQFIVVPKPLPVPKKRKLKPLGGWKP